MADTTEFLSREPAFIEDGPSSPSLYARLNLNANSRRHAAREDVDEDDDLSDSELFDELEREMEEEGQRDGVVGRLREERMEELKRQLGEAQAQRDAPRGSGRVTEPSSEKELILILGDRGGELDGSKSGMPIVVHFTHKEFRRCDIMNSHLEILASQHPETLFLKISVLSSPFLVEKLSIKVLPCLVIFGAKAQVKDRIVGFEDLGNSDGFTTKTLEWRLGQGGQSSESVSALHAFG
ncbi:hypothetical protein CBS101457_005513 [Exobasidium rhododendri]|nr:hypothetical protein CBS101457_005513 [Exobasidium rhododendri]